MVQQDRLDGLITVFIEQNSTYSINIDGMIQQFKILTPSEKRLVF